MLAALVITAMVVFAVSTYLLRDVAFERFTLWAYSSFGAADQTTDEDVTAPESATGSGWIDPDAARALEMMHRGDSAIVSMRYSFQRSGIAFIAERMERPATRLEEFLTSESS